MRGEQSTLEEAGIAAATDSAGSHVAIVTFFTTLLLMLWPLAINRAPFYSAIARAIFTAASSGSTPAS